MLGTEEALGRRGAVRARDDVVVYGGQDRWRSHAERTRAISNRDLRPRLPRSTNFGALAWFLDMGQLRYGGIMEEHVARNQYHRFDERPTPH